MKRINRFSPFLPFLSPPSFDEVVPFRIFLRTIMFSRFSPFFLVWISLMTPQIVLAQVFGPADASRIDNRVKTPFQQSIKTPPPSFSSTSTSQTAPKGSEAIHFNLTGVLVEGNTRLDQNDIRNTYAEYLHKNITLDKVWAIAAKLTSLYQAKGFFLSRVYVPQQEIGDGQIKLKVIEGYVSEIDLDTGAQKNAQVTSWAQRIVNKKPLNVKEIESLLLRLNDLGGHNYRAILQLPQNKNAPEGATRLSIVTVSEKFSGRVNIDNFGSRFMGPFEVTNQTSLSILPNQKTNITILSDINSRELRYGSIQQEIPLTYEWGMDFSGSITGARPGDTLAVQEIINNSKNYGVGFTYLMLRQRNKNISVHWNIDGRDIKTRVLGTIPLTEDHVRALRVGANYQDQSNSGVYNLASFTVSHGLNLFGASGAHDAHLSRADATPSFNKMEVSYSRLQPILENWSAVGALSGQWSDGPLYASEEFGFGGQNYGRAYDSSEITGDNGLAGSLELRYSGLPSLRGIMAMPYGFYDIGKVWNRDSGHPQPLFASSAGGGARFSLGAINANLGFAYPLTRPISSPLNGDKEGPRYIFQLSYDY